MKRDNKIRAIWEKEMGLVTPKPNKTQGNWIKGVPICHPKYPLHWGIMDGFFYDTNGTPTIVKFIGIVKDPLIEIKGDL